MSVINGVATTRIYVDHNITIHVADHVLNTWERHRQTGWKTEAFGVLMGAYDPQNNILFITECTEPMHEDESHTYNFKMLDKGHSVAVKELFYETDGYQNYVGTWHTHPEASPRPSDMDKKDWRRAIANNPPIPQFLFVIVGTKEIAFFPKKHTKGIR